MLETGRLALRQLSEADAGFIVELLNDEAFLRYVGDKGVRTEADARNYVRTGPAESYERLGFGLYRVGLKPAGQPIGICGLVKRDWLPDVDLGFAFLPRFRSLGYAFESASAMLAHARGRLGFRRVLAITTPDNLASIRLLEKLGFRFDRLGRASAEAPELKLFAADVSPREPSWRWPGSRLASSPVAYPFVPLAFERIGIEESRRRAAAFRDAIRRRRTVRDFAPDDVPQAIVDAAIEAAASAPSGANKQPWRFVVVRDPELKRQMREAAEAEEREFYERRATPEWLADLAPLGTDWRKPFLEIAPCLIVVFRLDYERALLADGTERHNKHYYVQESVGIAVGFLLAALHHAGLATLTHTPSPMGFLAKLLGRPPEERAFVLIPVGYPAPGATVPDITKKSLDEVRVVV